MKNGYDLIGLYHDADDPRIIVPKHAAVEPFDGRPRDERLNSRWFPVASGRAPQAETWRRGP